jgi:hypothetical protein
VNFASPETNAASAAFEKMNEQSMARAIVLLAMYFAVIDNVILCS